MKNIITRVSIVLLLCSSLIPFKAEAVMFPHGDTQLDLKVNIADVTMVIDALLGNTKTYMNFDMDRDGKVSIADVTCLIDYLLYGEWHLAWNGPEIPDSAEVFTVNGVTFAMMPVQGGEHCDVWGNGSVIVSLGDFYLGQTEVTQELWTAVMGEPLSYPSDYTYHEPGPYNPADYLCWSDCQEFISRLNELTGLEFHLPFTAQWLWAKRGGIYSHGYQYAGSDDLNEVAWYWSIIYTYTGEITMPVGLKKPNELGLYDMHGNVWEICYNYNWKDGDQDVQDTYFSVVEGCVQSNPPGPNDWWTPWMIPRTPAIASPLEGFRLALQKEQ